MELITLTRLDGTEFDVQTGAIILGRNPIGSDSAGAGAVLLVADPLRLDVPKTVEVEEDIAAIQLLATDGTLFVTNDINDQGATVEVLKNQRRVIQSLDNAADPFKYIYDDNGFEKKVATHNGDYASFLSEYAPA
jgi:hypothetical protein